MGGELADLLNHGGTPGLARHVSHLVFFAFLAVTGIGFVFLVTITRFVGG
ncbi:MULTISPECIES: hypothetical protein [Bradyrhizobium]|uniref:Uncharacterized protein n=2 Tax=Bradyrhizobium barranii TaxID=2992140 RepID=A0A850J058_9BRAD|nr:hypothetical protein [Bradyrhizobium barranii]UEM09765.1 hypothetical protein J4G43_034415 [Bradyrhizobium barranii subsp. barranii]UPT85080.1 hypothetical protein HAP41_0000032815 [Bradyrhizobium barranii subsp. apii]UPU00032.1 hypothetical protein J4G48_0019250 [Bradyrhizobium barranii subsp. apii]